MQTWITSDTHLGHSRIIQYTNRPFPDVGAMDEALIANWNDRVKDDDTVYHLGDFCFGPTRVAVAYFARLRGDIRILGTPWHHDKSWLPNPTWFNALQSLSGHTVKILPPMHVLLFQKYSNDPEGRPEGRPKPVVLCHYPIAKWDRSHYGSWHLYGHCHGQFQNGGLSMDVGVDATWYKGPDTMKYKPISIEEIACCMIERQQRGTGLGNALTE